MAQKPSTRVGPSQRDGLSVLAATLTLALLPASTTGVREDATSGSNASAATGAFGVVVVLLTIMRSRSMKLLLIFRQSRCQLVRGGIRSLVNHPASTQGRREAARMAFFAIAAMFVRQHGRASIPSLGWIRDSASRSEYVRPAMAASIPNRVCRSYLRDGIGYSEYLRFCRLPRRWPTLQLVPPLPVISEGTVSQISPASGTALVVLCACTIRGGYPPLGLQMF